MLRTIEGGPAITQRDVDGFERRLGAQIPIEYRQFLLAQNGGRPERDVFAVPGCQGSPTARVHFFCAIGDAVESNDLAWGLDVFGDLPSGLFRIGSTEGADIVCMMVGLGPFPEGSIVFWDDYAKRPFLVAATFSQFVDSLYRDPDSPRLELFGG